jgi:hypothetical protein
LTIVRWFLLQLLAFHDSHLSLRSAAVGKPQAIMSKEELEEKEANRTGGDVITKSKSSRSQSRSLAAIMNSKGDAPRLSKSHRSSTSHRPSDSDVEEVAVEVKRGMILPFEPLSISFDDVSYFVDMPAVRCTLPSSALYISFSKTEILRRLGFFSIRILTLQQMLRRTGSYLSNKCEQCAGNEIC